MLARDCALAGAEWQLGRPLNQVLAQTGQLELIFALLYSAGLLISKLVAI